MPSSHLPIHSPHETAPVILICFNGRGDESSACVRFGTLSSIYLGLGEVELKSTWVQQYREGAFAMVRIVGGYDFVERHSLIS